MEIENATGVTPKALLDMPELDLWLEDVARAYKVLAKRRTSGFGPNPIQLSEIKAYVETFGCPTVGWEALVDLIDVMDTRFLELANPDDKPSG